MPLKFYVKRSMSRLAEAEARLHEVLQRLESAARKSVSAREEQNAALRALAAEKDEVKAQAGDLAQRLDKAVGRLKASIKESV